MNDEKLSRIAKQAEQEYLDYTYHTSRFCYKTQVPGKFLERFSQLVAAEAIREAADATVEYLQDPTNDEGMTSLCRAEQLKSYALELESHVLGRMDDRLKKRYNT